MNYYAIKGPIIGEPIVVSLAPCCVCVCVCVCVFNLKIKNLIYVYINDFFEINFFFI
jgi:hypothetical protein